MLNQTDYDRINKHMIAPLCVLFRMNKMGDELVDGFVEELHHYNDEILKTAFKTLRRECKHMPSIAQALDACRASTPRTFTRAAEQAAKSDNHVLADRVMRSHIGQFAIKHGVGSSVWLKALVDSNEVRHESEVLTIRDKWLEAIDLLAAMPKGENRDRLTGIYEAMQAREQRIALKYAPMEIAA